MHPRWFLPLSVALAASCSSSTHSSLREPDDYQGCATDENWQTFDDYELTGQVKLDDVQAPGFTNLGAGMTLPAIPAYELQWTLSSTNPGKVGGNATCSECPSCGPLTTEHSAPVFGDVYDLQFATGGAMVFRALTTRQAYAIPDAAWSLFKGKTVTLRMTRMQLKDNEVVDGPYQPTKTVDFVVQP